MPNHISHKLTFVSNDENYQEVKARFGQLKLIMQKPDAPFDFNVLIPLPEELNITSPAHTDEEKAQAEANLAKYGAKDWYDWSIENWGTKWNAYEVTWGWNEVCFQTAWSYPKPIFKELSKRFPDTEIEIEYADEDFGANCGVVTWKNGKEIKRDDNKNNPHRDWHEFACRLFYEVEYNWYSNKYLETREELLKLKGEN